MSTTMSGPMVVYLFVGDRPGICCRPAVNKKNMLANFENCSKRNLGRKVATLYLAVETWLSTYLLTAFAGGLLRWMMRGPRVDGSGFERPKPNLKLPMSNFFSLGGGGT